MTTNYLLTRLAKQELLVIGEEKSLLNNVLQIEVMIYSVCDRRGGYAWEKLKFNTDSQTIEDSICHMNVSCVEHYTNQLIFEEILLKNVPEGAPITKTTEFKTQEGYSQDNPPLLSLFVLHRLSSTLRPQALRKKHKKNGACIAQLSWKLDRYVTKHSLASLKLYS